MNWYFFLTSILLLSFSIRNMFFLLNFFLSISFFHISGSCFLIYTLSLLTSVTLSCLLFFSWQHWLIFLSSLVSHYSILFSVWRFGCSNLSIFHFLFPGQWFLIFITFFNLTRLPFSWIELCLRLSTLNTSFFFCSCISILNYTCCFLGLSSHRSFRFTLSFSWWLFCFLFNQVFDLWYFIFRL